MASTSSALPVKDNQLVIGGRLSSGSSDYIVQSVLGRGAFGTVVKCERVNDKKSVAIKMIKNEGNLIWQTREEVSLLTKLKSLDSDKCNLVQWYQAFIYREYSCLEFEHLDKSLRQFMVERHFARQPVHLKEIRPIVQQVANALYHLKTVGIIHADIKLDNIMLVNHAQQPFRTKVIDFGLADEVSQARVGSYIQTRSYRAPEIILGLPYAEAIDVWSLGCVAMSLLTYALPFPGRSEYDVMRHIVETLGQPADVLLNKGCKTGCFFERDHNSTGSLWKLKTPEKYVQETGIWPITRGFVLNSLDDLYYTWFHQHNNLIDHAVENDDMLMFVDLLKGMLRLDAEERLTPRQVLEHPFITLAHMTDFLDVSSHVNSCFALMDVCQGTVISGSETAVCGSPGTANPIQVGNDDEKKCESSSSPDSTEHVLVTSSPLHAHPLKRSRTQKGKRQGIKRKMGDSKDEEHQGKKSGENESPSTSERSRGTQSDVPSRIQIKQDPSSSRDSCSPKIKRKRESSSSPDSTEHVLVTSSPLHAHPLKKSRTQKGKRQGMKRKMGDSKDEEHQGKKSGENQSPSTSERSRGTQSDVPSRIQIKQDPSSSRDSCSPKVKRKRESSSSPDSTEHVLVTSSPLHAHPLKRNRTQKGKRQGMKRKTGNSKDEEHQGKKSGENQSPSTSERSRGTQSDVPSRIQIKQDPSIRQDSSSAKIKRKQESSSSQDSSACDVAATAASCSEQHLLDLPPPLTVKVKPKSCSNQDSCSSGVKRKRDCSRNSTEHILATTAVRPRAVRGVKRKMTLDENSDNKERKRVRRK